MICEVIAILRFGSSAVKVLDRNTAQDERTRISGKNFESLGQERRIQTLLELKVVDKKQADLLEKVRTIRNNHLHFCSRHYKQMENEAYQVLRATIEIVKTAFFENSDEKKLLIKAEILEYLSRKLDSSDDEETKNWLQRIWGHREKV